MDYQRILVPVDGSESAGRAVRAAVRLAQLGGGLIEFLYVASITGGDRPTEELVLPEATLEKLKQAGNVALEKILTQIPAGFVYKSYIETGRPANVIVDFQKKNAIDLIVMGSRGLSAPTGMLLGSVSQRIVERAACPVMIVK